MKFRRLAAGVSSFVLIASGAAVWCAVPASAATCIVTAYEYSAGGYTRAYESNGTNCDYVSARTYTYLGGGQSQTTTDTDLASAIAYKTSGGSYSGGAWRARVNGAWSAWKEL